MPGSTSFFQECPICGRSLQVRLELLGRFIACPHCRGEFLSTDQPAKGDRSQPILDRANELLNWLPVEAAEVEVNASDDLWRDVG